jgi:hypothetical protein
MAQPFLTWRSGLGRRTPQELVSVSDPSALNNGCIGSNRYISEPENVSGTVLENHVPNVVALI